MLVFSDLHLRESSEEIVFRVLAEVERFALDDDSHVVFCGDFWHLRYEVNVRLLNRVADVMLRWVDQGLEVDYVPGNHDQVNIAGRNALEILEAFPDVRVWTDWGMYPNNQPRLGFVPYRKDPTEQGLDLMRVGQSGCKIIFGHFGMRGAVMNNGKKDSTGLMEAEGPLAHAPIVLGHYHRRQVGNGWEYVGSPYQTSFGEAGNECGLMHVHPETYARTWFPIDVGAPRHFILKWDPATAAEPPPRPGRPGDKIRLDIEASHEMIVGGKFKGVLEQAGLDDVQVQVIPTKVQRAHRFDLQGGETLLQAAERFARERMKPATEHVGFADRVRPVEDVMKALRRWAG